MAATKTLIHEYRSYGTADGCAACIAARADLAAMDRLVLDEVERVGWMRSEDDIHSAILRKGRECQESPRLSVLAALDRLAAAEMIERCEDDRPFCQLRGVASTSGSTATCMGISRLWAPNVAPTSALQVSPQQQMKHGADCRAMRLEQLACGTLQENSLATRN